MTRTHIVPLLFSLAAVGVVAGCARNDQPENTVPPQIGSMLTPAVKAANAEFAGQKTFDPWVLTTSDPVAMIPAYLGDGTAASTYTREGEVSATIAAGKYFNGGIEVTPGKPVAASTARQTLDLRTGTLTSGTTVIKSPLDWPSLWKSADITIIGDPESQQVVHANQFYLASSVASNGDNSVPPMGLSSNVYGGHIFWDADVWMLPALIAQYPDRAKTIVNYRFKHLDAAKAIASAEGMKGAEYPWESADTGKEEAPAEFAAERHITADVAFAAWQYYLWSGDKNYLRSQGWPILNATADYWTSRVQKGADGRYHVKQVLCPDETAGTVDDDAYTNAAVVYNLKAATSAAAALGEPANPLWERIASSLLLPFDSATKRFLENPKFKDSDKAKQADTEMLIYPLGVAMKPDVAGNTLDYCLAHTIKDGPAMTSSIDAAVAAQLGRGQQSLDLFHDSYRPFMRSGLDAFSEKRTANRVYFCTGMGGCLQSVLYGFGGLNIAETNMTGRGTLVSRVGDAALYVDPHLPPGWSSLELKGVKFRGATYTINVTTGNKVIVTRE